MIFEAYPRCYRLLKPPVIDNLGLSVASSLLITARRAQRAQRFDTDTGTLETLLQVPLRVLAVGIGVTLSLLEAQGLKLSLPLLVALSNALISDANTVSIPLLVPFTGALGVAFVGDTVSIGVPSIVLVGGGLLGETFVGDTDTLSTPSLVL